MWVNNMDKTHSFLKTFKTVGLVLILVSSLTVCAGVSKYGDTSTSWKEEVALHDSQTIIVKRTVKRGGRREPGQVPNAIYESLAFNPPNSRQNVVWEDKKTEDIGNSNFHPLLLDIVDNTPYLVTTALGCLSYNKWGRPNPPYIIFKYDGKAWQRITVQELPAQLTTPNLIVNSADTVAAKADSNLITATTIKTLNGSSIHLQYRTILRDAVQKGEGIGSCEELIPYGKGGWLGLDWFSDQPSHEACTKFCDKKDVNPTNCPCNKLFKVK